MRRSGVVAARAMTTRLLLAKRTRHGPELWKMPRVAPSRMSRSRGRLWPGAQTTAAIVSGDSLGQNQAGPIQFTPGHIASAAEARRRSLGNLSNYSHGIWPRLSLLMRILHRHGIFWRFYPLSYQ